MMSAKDSALRELMEEIVALDAAAVDRLVQGSPVLASARVEAGATRQAARTMFLDKIGHYIYAGDTALMSRPLPTGRRSCES